MPLVSDNCCRRALVALLSAVLIGGLTACSGSPIANSVQQGGTIVLPLVTGATLPLTDDVLVPAFGGSQVTDSQHGKLSIWLRNSSTGVWVGALPTRLTIAASMPVESLLARDQASWGRQLLLIADVPVNAPLGEFDVAVRRINPDDVMLGNTLQPFYKTIKILPGSISFTGTNGEATTAEGQAASSVMQTLTGTADWAGAAGASVPPPSFEVEVYDTPGPPESEVVTASYTVTHVTFPDTGPKGLVISEVLSRDPLWHTVWWEPDGPGQIEVHSISRPHWSSISSAFRVVYTYVEAEPEPFDLAADIGVSLHRAFDEYGVEIPVPVADPTLNLSVAADW